MLLITNHIKNIQYGDQANCSTARVSSFTTRQGKRFLSSRKNSDRTRALCTLYKTDPDVFSRV
jgi:hypothetical protein